jgi:RNA polymerase sigma-70 factor, ECF subfamily
MSDEPEVTSLGSDDDAFPDVLAAAKTGDDRAVEWLFVRLQPRLTRFLVAQEPRVAEDIAGEVWLAVASQIARFEGSWAEFRGWLFSIARRRLADHRRTAVRRQTAVEADVLEFRPVQDLPDKIALDAMSGQEAAKLITSTLRGDQADVLLLRLLADLDVDQVAQIMHRTANWVRVTQHRALRTLAKRVGSKIDVMG